MSKQVCRVCEKTTIFSTRFGSIAICDDCVLLGLEADKEISESGTYPNLLIPETFTNKPAASILFLHSYFRVNKEASEH